MILENDNRLIVILGMAHSGTTILTYLLRQHPEVFLGISGEQKCLLENDWLRQEHAAPIHYLLKTMPDKKVLLKRPWNEVYHAEWMVEVMPNAKFIYCYKNCDEICTSWARSDSNVERHLRYCKQKPLEYKKFLECANNFASKVKNFHRVFHPDLVANAKNIMEELLVWLELPPFKFNLTKVGNVSIKRVLGNS